MESRHAAVIDRLPALTPATRQADNPAPTGSLPTDASDPTGAVPAPRTHEHRDLGDRLAARIGAANFHRYFAPDATPMRLSEGVLEVGVASGFLASLIERRFRAALEEVTREATGRERVSVEVIVREATAAQRARGATSEPAARAPALPEPRRPALAPMDRATEPKTGLTNAAQAAMRFDLARFVVGQANRLAYESALRLARGETGPGARLLYLHGPHGCGKTHVLHGATALARQRDQHAGVRAVSGEQFANEYIQACRHKRVDTFQRLYRGLDVLGIDDLGGMTGKEGTLGEFVRTLEALHTRGARVIVTGPLAPRAMTALPDGLVSRLAGGMVCPIDAADPALREQFVIAQAQRRGIEIEPAGARWIAQAEWSGGRPAASLRELEGAVARVEAFARMHAGAAGIFEPVSLAAAERALGATGEPGKRSFAPGVPMPVRFEQVALAVCGELGVRFEEVLGTTRRPPVVLARSLIVYIARKTTGLSFPEIGRGLGRPGHSTAITAHQRIERELAAGRSLEPSRYGVAGTLADLCERLAQAVRRG